jgi:TFIIH basal transcription factor complex TTD-A subunit
LITLFDSSVYQNHPPHCHTDSLRYFHHSSNRQGSSIIVNSSRILTSQELRDASCSQRCPIKPFPPKKLSRKSADFHALGVLVECDPSVKAIILKYDEERHDYIVEDLDDDRHLVIKESQLQNLKERLGRVCARSSHTMAKRKGTQLQMLMCFFFSFSFFVLMIYRSSTKRLCSRRSQTRSDTATAGPPGRTVFPPQPRDLPL